MNQILVTGYEKVKKPKQKLGINTIVILYAISIIMLGICMISGSVYAKNKINETVEANAKPIAEINRNDDDNTVEIHIKHIRGITQIAYRWNGEKETIIDGRNQKELTEKIPLLGGVNTLNISVTEENGQTTSYSKNYTVGNIPKIELEAVSNGIKLKVTSENGIKKVTYNWDNNEEQQEIQVEKNEYEGVINAPKGQHTLKVEAIDQNGNRGIKTQVVVGDTAPTVTISAERRNDKVFLIIDAEDDEELTTMEITINSEEKQIIDVNDKKYHKEIELASGENKIIITGYNKNGLSTTLRRRVQN